jgi:transposase
LEWLLIAPLVPAPRSGGRNGGRPPVPRRDIIDAILYVVRTGCSWRQLPADFPNCKTVFHRFNEWNRDGTLEQIHDALRARVRRVEGRASEPTAAVVDAQSIRAADTVGAATRGYDAGKKTKGRKRHLVVDTIGLMLAIVITTASMQDRDGGVLVAQRAHDAHPRLRHIWADGGYAGRFVHWARERLSIAVEIVNKRPDQRGFEVLPRRWVVERTFAWITKCRRCNADYERKPEHAQAMITWAMIGLMTRRLARHIPGHDVTAYHWK